MTENNKAPERVYLNNRLTGGEISIIVDCYKRGTFDALNIEYIRSDIAEKEKQEAVRESNALWLQQSGIKVISSMDGTKWIKESTFKDQTRRSLRECINTAKAHLSEQFSGEHDVVINDVLENVLATMEDEV